MSKEHTNYWWVFPGFKIEHILSGLDLPVNIAFVPEPGNKDDDPLFYVTELYGQIKSVTNDYAVHTYAQNLLDYEPSHEFPGTGESGVIGICVEPQTGDLFVSMLYKENDETKAKVVRTSSKNGLEMDSAETVIDNIPSTFMSHQIQAVTIGPDSKLYVNIGDGGAAGKSQDVNDLRGKILRLNQNGSVPWDNPYPENPVYAKGLRNPFGGVWRNSDNHLYISDNGPHKDDRIAKIKPYGNYGWPGDMRKGSLFWWHHTQAPTAMDFMQGGQFPPQFNDHLFVALFGNTYNEGRVEGKGKRIVKIELNTQATAVNSYDDFVIYTGEGPASPCGLAFGPGGLYFSDLHGEKGSGGNIYKVSVDPEKLEELIDYGNEDQYPGFWVEIREWARSKGITD
ncbi:PQQ-dependent sugar dehydrogenase [Methanolobus halotolerans]|uniref:Glucose dehydrogenase n=1 Tax=Methanolobus halotolerans TaxID=2052935 RepID=A0A4E0QX04_9EURY|nr:PQQ-dependent sugar dehydrogenase [Methanolobus halotolerans]TGC06783.1 glucose dehydrogenase [Methanolobus halotolerans]